MAKIKLAFKDYGLRERDISSKPRPMMCNGVDQNSKLNNVMYVTGEASNGDPFFHFSEASARMFHNLRQSQKLDGLVSQ
jgi:hypothetical protein